MYFEVLGGPSPDLAPVLMIHGGGATGACFRHNLRGEPGWADKLAAQGRQVWVTDWPGCGRSGNRVLTDIEYGDVVEGYRRLLRDVIGEPVVVVCHSMGGAVTWQLVEHESDLVAGVVSVAAAFPGNLQSPSEVLDQTGSVTTVRFVDSGAVFVVDRLRGYLYEDDYIYRQAIGNSRHFPMGQVEEMRAGMVPLPPLMLLQRMGVVPGLPAVRDTQGFANKRISLVAGSEDPAHTLEIENATGDLLAEWGSDVEVVWLADRGIVGNGHFLFYEDNSDAVLEVVAEQVTEFGRRSEMSPNL